MPEEPTKSVYKMCIRDRHQIYPTRLILVVSVVNLNIAGSKAIANYVIFSDAYYIGASVCVCARTRYLTVFK